MKAYKGFELKCRGFQYEIGTEYAEDEAEICKKGFHACKNPLDVFGYYDPADSRYCEVDLDANDQISDDSKRVGKRIKISTEIGLFGLIKEGVEYIKNQIDWDNAKESNTGDYSAATVEGCDSVAVVTGRNGRARGSIGCFIVLAEWENAGSGYHIKDVKSAKVDGEHIKADFTKSTYKNSQNKTMPFVWRESVLDTPPNATLHFQRKENE